jgi:hypothetical protein
MQRKAGSPALDQSLVCRRRKTSFVPYFTQFDWIITHRDKLLFVMKPALIMALAGLLLVVPACSGNLSSRTARQQIAELGDATLDPDDVQIQRIVTELGDRRIAEANVRLTFQFERDADDEWVIIAARLGDREWIDIADLFRAIEVQNTEQTTDSLNKLSVGLADYLEQNGSLPDISADTYVSDVLHPRFMTDLIRDDAWGTRIWYQVQGDSYVLRSAGSDGLIDTEDDIVRGPLSQ